MLYFKDKVAFLGNDKFEPLEATFAFMTANNRIAVEHPKGEPMKFKVKDERGQVYWVESRVKILFVPEKLIKRL
jgi:hypothetical protein